MECGIALGSNTGDREAHLRSAVGALRAIDPALELSRVYETAPVDCPEGSGAFLNAVAVLRWSESPESLLATLRRMESDLGRPQEREKNAPRSIDLDILYAGDIVCHTPLLTLPHPRLHVRRFVLEPLAELRPDMVLPGFDCSVASLLSLLPPETP